MNLEKNIIFFDGVCGICNRTVDFLIQRDTNKRLYFSPLQGETASNILSSSMIEKMDTIVFYNKGVIYYKSGAVLRVLYTMGGIWKLAIVFLIVPPLIRNFIYDIVANNRYQWFGKKEACRIPTKEERERFC